MNNINSEIEKAKILLEEARAKRAKCCFNWYHRDGMTLGEIGSIFDISTSRVIHLRDKHYHRYVKGKEEENGLRNRT